MTFKNKKVLVTGSEGMIGKELVIQLKELGAHVNGADIKTGTDLTDKTACDVLFNFRYDCVFHLAGVKGSALMTKEKPADFLIPMLQFDTNMINAAHKHNVPKFLYTSSITVNYPDVDVYPARAKSTAEMMIEALRIQGTNTQFCIVRPGSVYGRFDDFSNPNAMVITSLINKGLSSDVINVWGDGSQTRDFINSKDVARGMIQAMEQMPDKPVNLCSGEEVSIKEIANTIAIMTDSKLEFQPDKQVGSQSRVMKLNWDFKPKIKLVDGLMEVIDYVKEREGETK